MDRRRYIGRREWAQGRGRAAVGQDGVLINRRDGRRWTNGVTFGGNERAQGRGRAA